MSKERVYLETFIGTREKSQIDEADLTIIALPNGATVVDWPDVGRLQVVEYAPGKWSAKRYVRGK